MRFCILLPQKHLKIQLIDPQLKLYDHLISTKYFIINQKYKSNNGLILQGRHVLL